MKRNIRQFTISEMAIWLYLPIFTLLRIPPRMVQGLGSRVLEFIYIFEYMFIVDIESNAYLDIRD